MLSEEQEKQIKQQLINQINSSFPDDKKQPAIEQIEKMDKERLENFLIQNNLIKNADSPQQCIFCEIIEGKISTNKIAENEQALAVLEINPISKGHSLVIPKQHSDNSP